MFRSCTFYRKRRSILKNPIFSIFFFGYASLLLAIFKNYNETGSFTEILVRDHTFEVSRTFFYSSLFLSLLAVHLISLLSCLWSINFRLFVFYIRTNSLESASHVYVKALPHCGASLICPIKKAKFFIEDEEEEKVYFEFQKTKFVQKGGRGSVFSPLEPPLDQSIDFYLKQTGIRSRKEEENLRSMFGKNEFEVPNITFKKLFLEHVSAPFFVFQVFVVILWSIDGYVGYSLFIISMLFIFEATMAFKRLKNLDEVRKMRFPSIFIMALREDKWTEIQTTDILPGDILSVRANKQYPTPCDMLILRGSCVVNEALLTGESTPQLKDSAENIEEKNALLSFDSTHRNYVVNGGTFVLSAENKQAERDEENDYKISGIRKGNLHFKIAPDGGAIAYALRTAYSTSQGKLLKTILYSTENPVFTTDNEAIKFLLCLLGVSMANAAYVFWKGLSKKELEVPELVLNCFMIITMVVPAELPVILSLTINNALVDLVKKKIFCSEGFRVPFSGELSLCCFDKTGTLTRDEFQWHGTKEDLDKNKNKNFNANVSFMNPLQSSPQILTVVGGCHSLTFLDGKLGGDLLEMAAFNGAKFSMNSAGYCKMQISGRKKLGITILRRFPFSSEKRKMSCVLDVRGLNLGSFVYVAKGAAESIKMSLKTVPPKFDEIKNYYSQLGYRVIATAFKVLSKKEIMMPLEHLDKDLSFEGFLLFSSPLRDDAPETIYTLRKSGHRCLMVTGDDILTAQSVAKKSMLITKPILMLNMLKLKNGNDEIEWKAFNKSLDFSEKSLIKSCLNIKGMRIMAQKFDLIATGDGLELFCSKFPHDEANMILRHFSVLARMSPQQKENFVRNLKRSGEVVLMCGDGTNDVGALKTANVGVALAEPADIKGSNVEEREEKVVSRKNIREKMKSHGLIDLLRDEFQKSSIKSEDPDCLHVDMNVASIASPFTARGGNLSSILEIVRHGRKTLCINLQMYQILALNCLIGTALFGFLYLTGQKLSDAQATCSELFATFLFLFVSSAEPLQKMAVSRPYRKVVSFYTLCNIGAQMAVHYAAMYCVTVFSQGSNPLENYANPENLNKFVPSVGNTMSFHLMLVMNLATFVANYAGEPYVQSLQSNRKFYKVCMMSAVFSFVVLFDLFPDFNKYLELVPLSGRKDFPLVLGLLLADFGMVCLLERGLRHFFCGSEEKGRREEALQMAKMKKD